jgi:uncharacterized protein (TIGR02147 family)
VKPLFQYEDYREYLRDFYRERKQRSVSYSFRYFARKAGLQSPNYYKLVMDGDRNLTHRNVRKFIQGLGLADREALYFENLVYFTQAKDPEEKIFFEKNLELVRTQDAQVLLTKDQHEALAHWYPFAIKELILVEGFQPRPKWIASRLDHLITPQQARDALDLLKRLNLIVEDEASGKISVTEQSLQTPDLARSDAVRSYHRQMLDMAQRAVAEQSADERCLSALTVAVRKRDLPEAFRRIHHFRNELNAFFMKGKPYEAVYQLNLQLFRLDDDV